MREQALVVERPTARTPGRTGYRIAITSGKGGVGKTQVSANLSLALAARGLRTLAVDLDLGLANLDVLFGMTVSRDLRHVVAGRFRPEDCVVPVPGGLHLLPAASGVGHMASLGDDDRERVWRGLDEASRGFDAVILDTAAGIGRTVIEGCLGADRVVLVTTPDPAALTDAYALLKVLACEGVPTAPVGLIVNMASDAGEALEAFRKLRRVVRGFLGCDLELMASITRNAAISRAARLQRPLLLDRPGSPAARTLDRIGSRLADEVRAAARRRQAS